jgi:hypothetical protein
MRSWIMLLFITFLAGAAQPPTPLKGGERILWVGNSYSDFWGPVSEVLKAFFVAQPQPLSVHFQGKGKGMGTLTEYYLGVEYAAGTLDSIRKGTWDLVVLQGWEDASYNLAYCAEKGSYSWENKEHPGATDTFVKYGKLLYDEAKKAGAEPVFFYPQCSAWNFNKDFALAELSYAALGAATDGFIVPVIDAWDTARIIFPPATYACAGNQGSTPSNDFIKIFYSDCGHQNGNGMLLTSSVWYTVLTGGKSPVNLHPTYPIGMTGQWDPGKEQIIKEIGYKTGLKILGGGSVQVSARRAYRELKIVSPVMFQDSRTFMRAPGLLLNGKRVFETGVKEIAPGMRIPDPVRK